MPDGAHGGAGMEASRLWGRGLEWEEVRTLLAAETTTPMGRARAGGITPLVDVPAVRRVLDETRQARAALGQHGAPDWGAVPDTDPILERCAMAGAVLDGPELLLILALLDAGARLPPWGRNARPQAPDLADVASRSPAFDGLRESLRRALDVDGSVRDEASARLRTIRGRIRELRRRITKELEGRLQGAEADRLYTDRYVTVRNGRYVLPLRAEARHRLRGIVHDRSQSGQTIFFEPDAVIDLNNDLTGEIREETAEVARILAELSDAVRAELPAIALLASLIGELDWIFARARLAERMDATMPALDAARAIRLDAARHPLLLAQSWRDPSRTVVPVDLELSAERPLLLVTGPNAGGKTIALKTLGLLCLMAQVGCHLPAAEGSRVPVLGSVFAIVGDEQSVAENLSTFSAIVRQLREVLARASNGSLVLLDELGAGTDPDEGAALAQAILEELESRGTLVMATTHLEPLKAFASTHPGARNASVEFDAERLAPTFRLQYDHPGQSYALAIAARLGLDPALIARAQSHRSEHAARLSELLARLDAQARSEAAREAEMARRESEAAGRLAEARAQLERAETRAQDVMERAKREAAALLGEIRRGVSAEWERLRTTERSRRSLTEARERVRELAARVPETAIEPEAEQTPPVPGDAVEAAHLGVRGRLASITGAVATVQSGTVTVRVPVRALRKSAARDPEHTSRAVRAPGAGGAQPEPSYGHNPHIAAELHLLGRRADEARSLVEKYLDDAFLAGLPTVRLVHGRGTGILRRTVHELLTDHPLVASFRIGEPAEGGDGATVADLKVS
jgi:DNA mismatch repair protein MutS2